MADPFSVAASVVGVATAALQLYTTVYNFIRKVRNAPREMSQVGLSMIILSGIMDDIADVLKKGGDIYQKNLVDRVKAIVSMFDNIHEEVLQIIASSLKSNARRVYSRMLWYLEARNMAQLLTRIEALKSSMHLVLHTIVLAIMQDDPDKEARSLLLLGTTIRASAQFILDVQEDQHRNPAPWPANGSQDHSPYEIYAPPPPPAALQSTAMLARPPRESLPPPPLGGYESSPFNSVSNPNGPFELDTTTQPRKSEVMRKSTRPDFPSPQAGRHTLTSATTDDLPNAKRPRAIGSDLDAQKSRPANSNSEVNGYQHFAKPSIRSRSLPRKPEEQSIALPMEKGLGNTVAPPEDTAAWLFRLGFEPKMPIGAGTTGGEDVKTSAPSNDRISQSGHEHQSKHEELIDFNVQHLSLASRIPLAPPAIISEKLWRIEVPSAISDLLSEWTNLDRKKIASIASISRAKEKEQDDMWDARTETTDSSASEDSWIEIRDKYASAEPGMDKQASAYAGYPGYTQVPPFHPTIDTSKKQGGDAADTSPGSDDVTRSKGSLIPLPADVAASLKGDEEEATDLKSVEQKFKDRMARLETLGEELQAARQAEREARQMAEAMNAEELKAVREHAKLEVKAAAEERERHQIMVDELKKKLAEVEATRKKSEEKAKRHNPIDDSLIGPVRFTDAIGRKFFVPWHICKTWKGIESIISEAFVHIDVIGQHVQDGHYDLIGPDEEIILPKLWEASVKPNWGIKMAMWPMHNDEGVPPPPDPPEDNALTGAMNPGGEGTSSKKKGKKPAASPSGPSPPTPPPEIDFHFSPGELPALPGGGKIPRPPGFPDFPPPPKSLPKAAQRRRRVVRRTGRNRRKNDGSVRTADSSLRTADSTNDDEELMQETKSGVRGWFSNWGSKSFNSVHKKG